MAKPLAPKTLALVRWQSGREPMDKIDHEREKKIGEKNLKVDPEHVSATSSTIPPGGAEPRDDGSGEREADMMAGIRSDLVRMPQSLATRSECSERND